MIQKNIYNMPSEPFQHVLLTLDHKLVMLRNSIFHWHFIQLKYF